MTELSANEFKMQKYIKTIHKLLSLKMKFRESELLRAMDERRSSLRTL